MFTPLERRTATQDETQEVEWQKITNQAGQFRGPDELHALARSVISLLGEPDSTGVAVLVYESWYDAVAIQNRIRGAVENLSKRKAQTKIEKEYNEDEKRYEKAKIYIRYRD